MNATFKNLLMTEAVAQKALFSKEKGKGKEYEIKNAKLSAFGDYTDRSNDIVIKATVHSKSQAKDRRPEYTKSDWEKLHKKVTQKIDDDGLYDDGYKLFYSKSMQQAYIAHLKFNDRNNTLNLSVITVLPKGKNNPQGGNSSSTTDLELMESVTYNDDMVALMENIDNIQINEME